MDDQAQVFTTSFRRKRVASSSLQAQLRYSIVWLLLVNYIFVSLGVVPRRAVWSESDLYAALTDTTVTEIELQGSTKFSISKGTASWPLQLNRNVTLAGPSGGPHVLLDFNYATSDRLVLAPGVQLTLRHLMLVNLFSRSQLAYDFFAPSDATSAIVWDDVVNRRELCMPMETILSVWAQRPRLPGFSGASQQQQQQQQDVRLSNETFCPSGSGTASGSGGRCWTPVLRGVDVAVASTAGYGIVWYNSVVVCDSFLSEDCIATRGLNLCYLTSMEALLAQRTMSEGETAIQYGSNGGESSGSSGLSSGAKAGIIVGCVIGGVALLALLFFFVLARRRRTRRAAAAAASASTFDALDVESDPAGIMNAMRSSAGGGEGGAGGDDVSGRDKSPSAGGGGSGTSRGGTAAGGVSYRRTRTGDVLPTSNKVAATAPGTPRAGGGAGGEPLYPSLDTTTVSMDLRSSPADPKAATGLGPAAAAGRWSWGRGSTGNRGGGAGALRTLAAPPQDPGGGGGGGVGMVLRTPGDDVGPQAQPPPQPLAPVSADGNTAAAAAQGPDVQRLPQQLLLLPASGSQGGGTGAASASAADHSLNSTSHPAGAGAGAGTHSVSSAVMALLKTMLGRGSNTHSNTVTSQTHTQSSSVHTHTRTFTFLASDFRRIMGGGGGGGGHSVTANGMAGVGAAGDAPSGSSAATAATAPAAAGGRAGDGGAGRGGGGSRTGSGAPMVASAAGPRRPTGLRTSPTEPTAGRGSSGGQPGSGPSRPTFAEIQQEVERLEGRLHRSGSKSNHGSKRHIRQAQS